MHVKIRGGTVKEGAPSLCLTCRHATVVQGSTLHQQIIECGLLSSRDCRVPFPVTSCTGYADRCLPSLRDMEDLAWVLRTDPRRKQVGFVHARDLKPHDRYVLHEDE
jgi:hypothetical protein